MSGTAKDFIAEVAKGARLYERVFVPYLFRPFAEDLVEEADLRLGDRVLDVGCGTGVVARLAADRVGQRGHVVGADPNAGFLNVARTVDGADSVEWVEADAQELAFPDASFDVVLSQQVFQFIPDRARAAEQIRRVLAPDGRALVSVWTSLDETPFMAAMARALERHVGPESAVPLRRAIFGLSDPDELAAPFREAGFREVSVHRHRKDLVLASPGEVARTMVELPPTSDEELAAADAIVADVVADLAPFMKDGGASLPTFANVATARR